MVSKSLRNQLELFTNMISFYKNEPNFIEYYRLIPQAGTFFLVEFYGFAQKSVQYKGGKTQGIKQTGT